MTVVHNERRKGTWGTPAAIAIMTIVVAIVGWFCNDELIQVRGSIIDLKSDSQNHYESLWKAFSSSQGKLNCVENQLSKCCKDAEYCA